MSWKLVGNIAQFVGVTAVMFVGVYYFLGWLDSEAREGVIKKLKGLMFWRK